MKNNPTVNNNNLNALLLKYFDSYGDPEEIGKMLDRILINYAVLKLRHDEAGATDEQISDLENLFVLRNVFFNCANLNYISDGNTRN